MKFHHPEYDHVFCDSSMICQPTPLNHVTITPSKEFPGFWFLERMNGGIMEGTDRRPIRKDALSYLLAEWGFPSAPNAWESTQHRISKAAAFTRQQRKCKSDCVYFLRAGPFIKIGFTSNKPTERVNGLKTGCPYEITVIGTVRGTQELEQQLHRRFAQHRANLEWFHAHPEILAFVQEHANVA